MRDQNTIDETEREVGSFISFFDARRMARQQMAEQQQINAAQIAEEEAAAKAEKETPAPEGPVENPLAVAEVPQPVRQFRNMQRMQIQGAVAQQEAATKYVTEPQAYNGVLDPDKALDAIFGNEGGKTGQRTRLVGKDGRKATATGRYQIVDGTREGIRKGHFKSLSKPEFERLYRSDEKFERAVARAHMSDLINKYGENALGAWYSPKFVSEKRWNEVPSPEYGNKATVGQYQQNAMKRYMKLEEGGFAWEDSNWLDKYAEGGETPVVKKPMLMSADYRDPNAPVRAQTREASRTGDAMIMSAQDQQLIEDQLRQKQKQQEFMAQNPGIDMNAYVQQQQSQLGTMHDGDFYPNQQYKNQVGRISNPQAPVTQAVRKYMQTGKPIVKNKRGGTIKLKS